MDPNELPDGQRVRIIGPDMAGDSDDLGKVGKIWYSRGGDQYWVGFPDGSGTTFDRESLEPVEEAN